MKYKAICVRCGEFKKDAFATCKACSWTPKTDFEAARSLILSLEAEYDGQTIGKSIEELKSISDAIRSGRPHAIDGEEQNRVVRAYYSYLKTIPAAKWYQSRKFKTIVVLVALAIIILALSYFSLR